MRVIIILAHWNAAVENFSCSCILLPFATFFFRSMPRAHTAHASCLSICAGDSMAPFMASTPPLFCACVHDRGRGAYLVFCESLHACGHAICLGPGFIHAVCLGPCCVHAVCPGLAAFTLSSQGLAAFTPSYRGLAAFTPSSRGPYVNM